MSRRAIALVLAVVAAAAGMSVLGSEPIDPPADGPNVVVIMTDDMRLDELQFMPHTRRLLGDQGVTFTQMLSSYPLCCPARASFLSGQYPHNNGVRGNAAPNGGYYRLRSANTLPVWLDRQGYDAAHVGKYLNEFGGRDDTEIPPGWDDFAASVYRVYDYNNMSWSHNGEVDSHPRVYQTSLIQEQTLDLVERYADSDRPYFLWMSHVAPHSECTLKTARTTGRTCWGPPTPAPGDKGAFADLPPVTNPAVNERDVSDKGRFMRSRPLLSLRQVLFLQDQRIGRAESLLSVDRSVAELVEELKETGEYDNTYIMFTSDNGFQLGEHRWQSKILGYEPSIRVPMIITGPGIPAGEVRHQGVSTVDITATIADLAGIEPGLELDGRSLMPLATGALPDVADRVVPLEAGPKDNESKGWLYQGVRTDRYTLLRWRNGDIELYDRKRDPYQVSSVADDPAYADVRQDLLAFQEQLEGCAGEDCFAWYEDEPVR